MEANDRPLYDAVAAESLVGKRVLMGITYFDHAGAMIERKELHGVIASQHERRGFLVNLEGQHAGESFTLPPDTRAFQPAARGEYKLKNSPEVIRDPDLLCIFSITKPAPDRHD